MFLQGIAILPCLGFALAAPSSILARQDQFTLTAYKAHLCQEPAAYTWPIGLNLDPNTEECFSLGNGTESIGSIKVDGLPKGKCVLVSWYLQEFPCGSGLTSYQRWTQNEPVDSRKPIPGEGEIDWSRVPDQQLKSVGLRLAECPWIALGFPPKA
ncbi:hypothetical protein BGZ63DRAFT_457646 [Mariannaea sp. PMI_226]|nr:hypothetical protein BGZ63DRAFT_457646 [Mariannaea sp. PMI_226]